MNKQQRSKFDGSQQLMPDRVPVLQASDVCRFRILDEVTGQRCALGWFYGIFGLSVIESAEWPEIRATYMRVATRIARETPVDMANLPDSISSIHDWGLQNNKDRAKALNETFAELGYTEEKTDDEGMLWLYRS